MVGISKNEEMMAGYEPCLCRDTCWKKKKKRDSLAIEKMSDRPIDGDEKLKKKGTKTGTVCVGWKEK